VRRGLVVVVVLLLAACGESRRLRLASDLVAPVVSAGVPGVMAFAVDGGRTETAAAGLANIEAHRRLAAGDRFRIGSVTKTFVATVVLQLVAEKRLRLDDTVARWLPGLLPDGGRITICELLAHRSGLADVADDPKVLAGSRSNWPARRLVKLAAQEPRTAPPGRAFRYSSTNYLALGLIIERVTGRSVASELENRIVKPLRLDDTAYVPGPVPGVHMHGYRFPSHQGVVDPTAQPRDLEQQSVRWAGASGDLVSSEADVARFLRSLLRGELLPPAQLRAMETLRSRYGLGLAVHSTPCGRAWGHTGNLNGVLTIAWSTLDGRKQVVVAANAYPLPPAADTALRRAAEATYCSG
jgi:D-alanyl-D-alanine carboxypeptidase